MCSDKWYWRTQWKERTNNKEHEVCFFVVALRSIALARACSPVFEFKIKQRIKHAPEPESTHTNKQTQPKRPQIKSIQTLTSGFWFQFYKSIHAYDPNSQYPYIIKSLLAHDCTNLNAMNRLHDQMSTLSMRSSTNLVGRTSDLTSSMATKFTHKRCTTILFLPVMAAVIVPPLLSLLVTILNVITRGHAVAAVVLAVGITAWACRKISELAPSPQKAADALKSRNRIFGLACVFAVGFCRSVLAFLIPRDGNRTVVYPFAGAFALGMLVLSALVALRFVGPCAIGKLRFFYFGLAVSCIPYIATSSVYQCAVTNTQNLIVHFLQHNARHFLSPIIHTRKSFTTCPHSRASWSNYLHRTPDSKTITANKHPHNLQRFWDRKVPNDTNRPYSLSPSSKYAFTPSAVLYSPSLSYLPSY